jgi:recombinational DNA repair protein RecT
VKRSGAARHVDAKCVYENEVFRYEEGTHPFIEHHPIMDPTARGKMVGAYAWAMINQRTPIKIAVLSVAEIDEIRQKNSKSHKEGPLEPWYACKTMVHQVTEVAAEESSTHRDRTNLRARGRRGYSRRRV